MDTFGPVNWQEPLDVAAAIGRVPPTSSVKGVFFRTAVSQTRAATGTAPGRPGYDLFSDYPTAELVQVLADCAGRLYPGDPVRLALRRLGQDVFTHLKSTTAGTFLFSVAGNNVRSAFKLVGRAYKLFSNSVTASYQEQSEGVLVLQLRNVWSFPDSYHVGIFEGAANSYGVKPDIRVHALSPCDVDLRVDLR